MIVDRVRRNPESIMQIVNAVELLHAANAFGALLEICAQRTQAEKSSTPVEHAAIRAGWKDGYAACLQDLANFKAIYVDPPSEDINPGSGTAKRLLDRGMITQEEYEYLRQSDRASTGR